MTTNNKELRDLYLRCDVSNNGTENPISFDEFAKAIKDRITEARIEELRKVPKRTTAHIYGQPNNYYSVTPQNYIDNRLDTLQAQLEKRSVDNG